MMMNRCTLVGGLLVVAAGLTGCSSGVSMDNQSDSWVNVRYYIATPSGENAETLEFVSVGRQQIEPGTSSSFELTSHPSFSEQGDSVIHVVVEPLSATWEEAPQYWLELLTPVPLNLSVSGTASEFTFSSEDAEFAQIPEQTRVGGEYQYTRLAAPEPSTEDASEPSSSDTEVAEVIEHEV